MGIIRNIVAALLGVALMQGVAHAEVRWDLANSLSPSNFLTGIAADFIADVKQSTNGKLIMTLHPGGSLFSQSQIKRAVRTGQIQVGEILLSSYSNEDPIFGIDSLPFLTSSYEEAWKLWLASKAPIVKRMSDAGMMVLYSAPLPPQELYSKSPVSSVADLKGVKWRAYSPLTSRLGELVGAQPVTIMAPELAQALATGAVGAFMTSSGTGYDSKVYEQVKYLYDTRAWIPKELMLVNNAAFENLDKPVQKALLAAAERAERKAWKVSKEKNAWYLQQLAAHGMTVQPPSKELKAQLKKIGKKMTGEWAKAAGPDAQAAIDRFLSKN